MRVVPNRSPWLQLTAWFGAFVIGPFVSLRTGMYLLPESNLVVVVNTVAFVLIFVFGTLLWMGLGIAAVVARTFWGLIRGGGVRVAGRIVPPGYSFFVVLGLLIGGAVGLVTGLTADLAVLTATGTWALLGLGYGLLLWALGRHGYLPFPEPE